MSDLGDIYSKDSMSQARSSEEAADGPVARWQPSSMQSKGGAVSSLWRQALRGCCNTTALNLTLFFATLILGAAIMTGVIGPQYPMSISYGRLSLGNCGASPREAQQRGCVFDVMATDWVRAECKNKELSDALFKKGNWTFYRDPEGTQVIPHQELLQGHVTTYYSMGAYHFSHCAYVWQKQLRQMGKAQMVLDSKARNWPHSMHCLYMLAAADTKYIGNKTASITVLGNTRTGDSVDCIAGAWERSREPVAVGFRKVSERWGGSK